MSHADFGGKKEFTFTWHIENYSYCRRETLGQLISPVFAADTLQGTRWTLKLFPMRQGFKPSSISFYLKRSPDTDGPENFAVLIELSFTAPYDSALNSYRTFGDGSFKKGEGKGYPMFWEDRVRDVGENYKLPQDTLTVSCKMWKDTGGVSESGQCSARTRIGIERVSFVQVVERFSSLQPNVKATALSESISKELPSTSMSMYTTDGLHGEEIMVEIEKLNCKQTKLFSCVLCLLDAERKTTQCGQSDACCESSGGNKWKFPLGYSKKSLLNKNSKYLPNDSLSVRCECIFTTGPEIERVEEINYGRPWISTTSPNADSSRNLKIIQVIPEEFSDYPSALDDFRSMYEDQTFSDVEITTKTETFFAHKSVLCSRSPVFMAIFKSDMKEKASHCIRVDDLEDDTVRRLLLFLYSDTVDDLQWDIAEKLYYAADKYQIKRLKAMCTSFLMGNLSASNAIGALVLSDRHQDQNLKRVVLDFILVRDEEIFGSDAWEAFMKVNPLLALETIHLKYKKK